MGIGERVVDQYGTGHVQTKIISRSDGDFTWIRTPGAARSQPFGGPPDPIRSALAAWTTGHYPGARCVLPQPHGPELRYTLPGHRSAAELLLSGEPAAHTTAEGLLHGLGVLLRVLHETTLPAGSEAYTPLTYRRLSSWTDTPQGDRATRLHGALRTSLGPTRWNRVRQWLGELLDAENRVLVHGGPGLGLLVAAAGADAAALLTGEDAGLGPRQGDVGWVLGELSELRTWSTLHRPSADSSLWDRAEAAFNHGYGQQPDLLTHRAAVLRVLLHLHDFCVFVTWDQAQVQRYTALLKGLIDDLT
ncbi:hypothetical protein [Streptomyces sp. ISL-94]|uniref:hypothetical protein n=1 Tax=Streptomyces sp. ISL-94 TaxID=2819190 RepID=UPI001BE95D80|nr:hypothetical protein [Streptomyces sp. ISL-94]MBT2446349.1 hypothetical protein [Streptomyces sp. ISL-43]MBT2478763.1 hypothetical protein [Streptomyces sp. ISL-94]